MFKKTTKRMIFELNNWETSSYRLASIFFSTCVDYEHDQKRTQRELAQQL